MISGARRTPSRTVSTPTPLGPPNLWALNDIMSTSGVIVRRSSQHAACTASVCNSACRGQLANEPGDGGEIGDRADLVVDRHHADDRDIGPERRGEIVEVDLPAGVDAHDAAAEMLDDVEHGVVLGRGTHRRAAIAQRPDDGGVVALGATSGEHDFAGQHAECGGNAIAGLVDGAASVAGEPMRTARVGEPHVEERQHRGDRLRAHGRRRGVVEIGE